MVYHLNLDTHKIAGAKIALLPGDPGRVNEIGAQLDPSAKEIAYKREYRTYLTKVNGKPILVTSTGIGGPSTSIAVGELAQIGVKTFIRVGTTGAIQQDIKVGDVIISSGAVRLDGASTHYAPIEYPAVAHYEILNALVEAAKSLKLRFHVGITASCDTFYPGQERYDSYSKYVIRRFQGSLDEWRKLQVLNYEMEAATLLTMCSALGLCAGCVTGVIVNRAKGEHVIPSDLKIGESNAIKVAVEAVRILTTER